MFLIKKTGWLLILCLLLISCGNKKKENIEIAQPNVKQIEIVENTNEDGFKPRLVLFLGDFLFRYSNWDNNSITINKTNEALKEELVASLNEKLLDSIPVKLIEINEYKMGLYAAFFKVKNIDYQLEDNTHLDIEFNIIGLLPNKLIDTLESQKEYYIKGTFLKFLGRNYGKHVTEENFKYYIKSEVYPYKVALNKENEYLKTDLGIMLLDIKEVILALGE